MKMPERRLSCTYLFRLVLTEYRGRKIQFSVQSYIFFYKWKENRTKKRHIVISKGFSWIKVGM